MEILVEFVWPVILAASPAMVPCPPTVYHAALGQSSQVLAIQYVLSIHTQPCVSPATLPVSLAQAHLPHNASVALLLPFTTSIFQLALLIAAKDNYLTISI